MNKKRKMNLQDYLSSTLPSSILPQVLNSVNQSDDNEGKETVDALNVDENSSEPYSKKRLKTEDCEKQAFESADASATKPIDTDEADSVSTKSEESSDEHEFLNILQRQSNMREILKHIIPSYVSLPANMNDAAVLSLLYQLFSSENDSNLIKRQRIPNINTIDDVVKLINTSTNIIVLTGAGCRCCPPKIFNMNLNNRMFVFDRFGFLRHTRF